MLTLPVLIAFIVIFALASLLSMASSRGARRPGNAVKPHPFNVKDLVTLDRVGSVTASPDGKTLAFIIRGTDLEKNCGVMNIWLVDHHGNDLRQLTRHESSSHSPVWAPDGNSIYFLSGRIGGSQVWRIGVDGGEAEQITNLALDVDSFKLSPNGKLLVVSADVFPRARTLADTTAQLEAKKEQQHSGMVFDQLLIRHWDTWKDGRRNHLFVVPVEGGDAVPLMRGMNADCPSKPFGGAEEYTFTRDSKSVVFSAKDVGRKEAWSTQHDLWVVSVTGKGRPKKLTPGNGAVITNPVFSPDGKTLACLAMARPGYEADRLRIATMKWPGGKLKMLTEEWDRSAYAIVWAKDGKTIYTHADHLGHHPMFAVSVKNGAVKQLTKKGKVTDIAVTAGGITYGHCHHASPTELFTMRQTSGATKQITKINTPRLANVVMSDSTQFTFKGWNNDTVYGWYMKPINFNPRKKYPVAFLIHGGPQGSFGNDFHYRWNPQVYAAAGYAVMTIDFHASTGYGQDFTDAINNHWGDRPVEDLQKGLAAALKKCPWMDPKRIGALGASYGGYLINWIHGIWNDPFKCFICHDGNIDERMAYYDTEELWFPEWERGGTPWQKPEAYSHHNPIDHVKKWKVPTLVIHSAMDFRVVDTQGISTFTALQRKGVPSRLLFFPDENHWVLKPHNSIQWHDEVIGWLDRYLK